MAVNEIDTKIYEYLDRLSRALRFLQQKIAYRHGISTLQLQVLQALSYKNYTIENLAKELLVTTPTLSVALKKLQKKNLIQILDNPQDKRYRLIRLSELGLKKSEEIKKSLFFPAKGMKNLQQVLQVLHDLVAQVFLEGILNHAPICKTCQYFKIKGKSYYCGLLRMSLSPLELRTNCPDHKLTPKAKFPITQ